ncbi:hypothetical protein [Maledivibacter halophilus]|uniref:Uncharacterized protein n=1 Tax=Maledivibacter halophilus TaxID=36842 RepID=A0A1T5KFP2_9FIRM|nr:hypothetical protein [Maledivibacter halophilus]SKC62208.1 hypothetical protein SAMN02194393_01743 [Maledivibacter halophilus]
MDLVMDIIYSSIIILTAIFSSFLSIKAVRNGNAKTNVFGVHSNGFLINFALIIIWYFSLKLMSSKLMAKISAALSILILVLVDNILRYKYIIDKKEYRIVEIVIFDTISLIGLLVFLYYAWR